MKRYEIRGFKGYEFQDRGDRSCSIQESSDIGPSIWLGLNEVTPQLFLPEVDSTKTGWIDYPLPESVRIFSRMELTQDQVKELLPVLQFFADNGRLPNREEIYAFSYIK